jgi:tight adherence protein B
VTMPAAALWYGLAIGAAGLFLVAAMTVADKERIVGRLGPMMRTGSVPTDPQIKARGRLEDRAATRGWPWGFGSYLAAHACGQMIGFAFGLRLAGPVGALGGAVGLSLVLESWLARKRATVREKTNEQFRDVLTALAAGTRAGLSLRRALMEAARDAESPIRQTLEGVLHRIEVGEPIEEALEKLATGSNDARLVTTLLAVHRRTGGDLPTMLDEMTDIVGARTDTRRQARALSAQGRASGAVLAVLPVAFVGLLSGTSGSGLGAFYRTATGSTLLLAGLALQGMGFLWLRRIARTGGSA